MQAERLLFTAPGKLVHDKVSLPPLKERACLVKALYCGISAGTERLAFLGQIPESLLLDESIPELKQAAVFPYPYGYCLVGQVLDCAAAADRFWIGKRVLVFHPHQNYLSVNSSRLIALPETIDARAAVMLPNMETAVNLVLDGAPLLGENAVITGLGCVGRLVLFLLQQFPLESLHAMETSSWRITAAENASGIKINEAIDGQADLVFELSGNPAAFQKAIDLCGYNGRVLAGSWFGSKPVRLDLGSAFHRKRIRIISSQVSTLAPGIRESWDFGRRMRTAVSQLEKIDIEKMITHTIPFSRAEDAYSLITDTANAYLQIILDMETGKSNVQTGI